MTLEEDQILEIFVVIHFQNYYHSVKRWRSAYTED
jgi:hypothetical protein